MLSMRLKRNLLLVRVIVNIGYVMMFEKQTCWIVVAITLHNFLAIDYRDLVNGLYKLEIAMPPKHEQPTSLLLLVKQQLVIKLQHKRWAILASKDYINFLGYNFQVECLVHSNYYGDL